MLGPFAFAGRDGEDSVTHAEDEQAATPDHSAIPRYGRNLAGRDYAVGDVHGCFTALDRALDAIGFDARVDRPFSVGDLVDRGPESHRVLQWLDRSWFHAVCGNHELMTWRSALGDPYPHVDHLMHGGGWLARLTAEEQRRIGRRLARLPLAIEVETAQGLVGLVHADCPFDDWHDMQRLRWDTLEPTGSIGDCCLWSIARYDNRYERPVKNIRAVVHGHITIRRAEVLGNVHFIDTGGWRPGGHFTLLELETLKPQRGPSAAGRKNR